MFKRFQLFLLACSCSSVLHAEVYCVSTAAQLRTAFSDAAASPAASEIRVRTGFYTIPPTTTGGIALQTASSSSLTMSGGWTGSNGFCTDRMAGPEQTVLSADGAGSLLRFFLVSGAATEIELHNFSFRQAAGASASCLEIESDAGSDAIVRIDRNSFRLCTQTSTFGSALRVTARSVDVYIRNNVFTDNASVNGVVRLSGFGGSIFYVSNNTLANNPQVGAGGGPGGMQISGLANDFVWFSNNVLWNNGTGTGFDLLVGNGTPIVLNNNLIGELAPLPAGAVSNASQIGVDPGFTASVDFRPLPGSPMRNTGVNPAGGALVLDFASGDRVQGTRIDRGAYEFPEVFANGFE